jgi:small subunit ribosomal protein S1
MDLGVRNHLLGEMRAKLGIEPMMEVARSLLNYLNQVTPAGLRVRPHELQAQRWAAMAYLDNNRGQAVRELIEAISTCVLIENNGYVKGVNWAELARLLCLVEEMTPQLNDYPELVKYAELTSRIMADTSGEDTLKLLRSNVLSEEFRIEGMVLPKLDIFTNKKRYYKIAAAAFVHNESWKFIEESHRNRTPVTGQVIEQVRGGLLVDVGGIVTFLPSSQVDVHYVSNLNALHNQEIEALVIEASKELGRIILSRKALIEEKKAATLSDKFEGLEEGIIIEGRIEKIADFGAFINLGKMDGLLHIREMSWSFVDHPSSLFNVGDSVVVKIIKIDRGARKIDLSYKELLPNPWPRISEKYSIGTRTEGTIVAYKDQWVIVELEPDVVGGLSVSELRESREISHDSVAPEIGRRLDVLVVELDEAIGRITLSLKQSLAEIEAEIASEEAINNRSWDELQRAYDEGLLVRGRITARVRGGMEVDLNGIFAFLPGSLIDIRPVRNLDALVGQEIEAKIINLNRKRSNVVLSRKIVLDEQKAVKKRQILKNLEVGNIVEGQIKGLTDYGAFVDLGGIDALLHLTDMSWVRVHDPAELFKVGETVQVKILKFDRKHERVSVGYKQLLPDPWDSVEERFVIGNRVSGVVATITDYGAFIELAPGVEGLVHVSEMTWSKRTKHPSKVVNVGDTVDVEVLSIDPKARRISLSMKHTQPNPWESVKDRYHIGDRVRGRVRNLTDYGAFVEVEEGVDGLVHVSDISWNKRIKHPGEVLKKGQEIEAVITNIDMEKRHLSLSIKDSGPSPWDNFIDEHKPGDIVRGKITRLANFGAFVELAEGFEGMCHVSELSDDPVDKPEDVVQIGQEMDFRILHMEPDSKKVKLSARVAMTDHDK